MPEQNIVSGFQATEIYDESKGGPNRLMIPETLFKKDDLVRYKKNLPTSSQLQGYFGGHSQLDRYINGLKVQDCNLTRPLVTQSQVPKWPNQVKGVTWHLLHHPTRGTPEYRDIIADIWMDGGPDERPPMIMEPEEDLAKDIGDQIELLISRASTQKGSPELRYSWICVREWKKLKENLDSAIRKKESEGHQFYRGLVLNATSFDEHSTLCRSPYLSPLCSLADYWNVRSGGSCEWKDVVTFSRVQTLVV
ncbi:hypothetical protein J6590_105405 [Homalodisca vitripennis]|nr:hypothetical protein J6590_105405 [Homalodisca vitripennis]